MSTQPKAQPPAPPRRRRRGHTRISQKNQVTLPLAALAEAHMAPGDELKVEADGDGRLVLTREKDPWDDIFGSMPGLERAVDLQALRDEWER